MNGSGNYYPYEPKKNKHSTGRIVAIILAVAFALLLLGGATVTGVLLFDPDSSISLYARDEESSSGSEKSTQDGESTGSSGRKSFGDDSSGQEMQPDSGNNQTPSQDQEEGSGRNPGEGSSEATSSTETTQQNTADISVDSAADSVAGVKVGNSTETLSASEVYDECYESIVSIQITTSSGSGVGSGIIMTSDGYILTNAHVVSDATSVMVVTSDGTEYAAVTVGYDDTTDIAVIRVDATNLKPATFGDSDKVDVGDEVYAIGTPLGIEYSYTMTHGIISQVNRTAALSGYSVPLLQTDTPLNPGNSGGALISDAGEVIGVTSSKIMITSGYETVEGISFAIPSNTALEIAKDLAANGKVTGRAYLGVMIQDAYIPNGNQYETGVVIAEVEEDSPAEKAGLQVNDVILSFNGVEITSTNQLIATRDTVSPGDQVDIVVERNGEEMRITVTMGES